MSATHSVNSTVAVAPVLYVAFELEHARSMEDCLDHRTWSTRLGWGVGAGRATTEAILRGRSLAPKLWFLVFLRARRSSPATRPDATASGFIASCITTASTT